MPTELAAMERAVELAWRGWGRVSPNPMVGCVLLDGEAVVGEGWHGEFGGVHAERMALEATGDLARGATAVVTLEPCAHVGKQPPCTEALIAAGVGRVVIGVADPNPLAAGGAARLREAGITVEFAAPDRAVRRQLASFLHQHRGVRRPWVALKLATSLDGRIADHQGRSQWISGPEARDWVHWYRAGFDAIGVGGATVAVDDPSLTVRGAVQPRVPPRRIVFAGKGGVAADRKLLRTAGEVATIIVALQGVEVSDGWQEAGATVLEADTLPAALEQLWEAGVMSLLVEGGGRLAGSLLTAGVVDRVNLIQAPLFLGDRGAPSVAGLGVPLADSERWVAIERRPLGADTLLVLERA